MSKFDERLGSISDLLDRNRASDADVLFRELLNTTPAALASQEPALRLLVDRFAHKRRRDLGQALTAILRNPRVGLDTLALLFRERLEELSARHLFQWSTFYRDTVDELLHSAESYGASDAEREQVILLVNRAFSRHASDIYGKGFAYQIRKIRVSGEDAILKSITGLQRFLNLPLEYYSSRLPGVTSTAEALTLRAVSSAALLGILQGYGHTSFDSHRGWNLLDRFPRSWLHTLAFLTESSLKSLLETLPETEIRIGLDFTLTPLLRVFDILAAQADDSFQLPRLSQFIWNGRRLEISLALPRHLMQARPPEVHCYLVPSQLSQLQLSESLSRDAAVIAFSPPPGFVRRAQLHDVLLERLVDTTPATERAAFDAHVTALANRALSILRDRANQSISTDTPRALTHNLAELFPLHNPFLTNTYYFIHRDSVKHLIARLEADTGVRLWCSLRRSGKTTACFDLAATSANTALVSQTMDDTEQRQNAGVFARKFLDYLHTGRQLPPTFLRDTALECLDDYAEGQKIVFVLDEYETLFDQLSLTAADRPALRYTLGQPLLNQMVAFSRDNVLIFIGQQPDAHYILMEQNQLSPCVRQDSFPLFQHNRGSFQSEFTALLRKILTEQVTFDAGFADGVFAETHGHPFLTVNLMRHYFSWLIEGRRVVTNLHFKAADFDDFSKRELRPAALRRATHYDFFRHFISHALSDAAARRSRWLHVVATLIQRLTRESPDTFALSRTDFRRIARPVLSRLNWDEDYILNTASQANFISSCGDTITPSVTLFARLASITLPRVS